MIRLALVAAAALTSAAAVAGCASSSSSTTQPAAPASPSASSATSAPAASASAASSPGGPASPASSSPGQAGTAVACTPGSLRVSLGAGDGYAGGVYQAINFTNTSSAPCTLHGFPGVSLVDRGHSQIGLAAKRPTGITAQLVTLAPRATAHATVQIVDALNYPAAVCSPAKAANLRVYPPNQTVAFYLPSTATACTNIIPILYVRPVQAGSG